MNDRRQVSNDDDIIIIKHNDHNFGHLDDVYRDHDFHHNKELKVFASQIRGLSHWPTKCWCGISRSFVLSKIPNGAVGCLYNNVLL